MASTGSLRIAQRGILPNIRRKVPLPYDSCSFPAIFSISRISAMRSHHASPISSSKQEPAKPLVVCPKCSTKLPPYPLPTCPSVQCNTLLPPLGILAHPDRRPDHFQLLAFHSALPTPSSNEGLELCAPRFDPPLGTYKRNFIELQRLVHPDKYTNGSNGNQEQVWAEIWSRRVNDAWVAINDDLKRAEYLLQLYDISPSPQDPASIEKTQTKILDTSSDESTTETNPELLMLVMEAREELEDATSAEEVERIRERNSQITQEALNDLKMLFKPSESGIDLEKATEQVIRLRYLKTIERVCREWEWRD